MALTAQASSSLSWRVNRLEWRPDGRPSSEQSALLSYELIAGCERGPEELKLATEPVELQGLGGTGPHGNTSRFGTSVRLMASSMVDLPTVTVEMPV